MTARHIHYQPNFCLRMVIFLIILGLVAPACGSSAAQPIPTNLPPTPEPPTDTIAPTASPAPTDTAVPTSTSKPTTRPTSTPKPTATPNLTATAQNALLDLQLAANKAKLDEAGKLIEAQDKLLEQMRTEGAFTLKTDRPLVLDNFEDSWAQRNWYRWLPTVHDIADFVIMTHMKWDSAQAYNLSWQGGCGFVLRLKDKDNHLLVYLLIGRTVELDAVTPSSYKGISPRWTNPDLKESKEVKGEADFALAAEGKTVTVYIDGVRAYAYRVSQLNPGDIGFTVISGTNKGFGTSCKMTGTRVWELK